jgi:ADP-heptose:LPS heptosyltransferase
MAPRTDCKYYIGEKPCKMKRLCAGCTDYRSRGVTIVVLKLGAMGDALRTTPLLTALKRKYSVSYITWITDTESYPVLENNPLIDELLVNSPESTFPLLAREFDLLLCLDKDPSVTSLAVKLDASVKKGFSMTRYGTLDIFNEASRYALALGLDDDLKFLINKKTYQEIVYEMVELPYIRDEYVFGLPRQSETRAIEIIKTLEPSGGGPKVGLNTGCGDVFATKKWPDANFLELIRILRDRMDARVYLLGGVSETETNAWLETVSERQAVNTGCNPLDIFAGILKQMDLIVTGDTMALHLGLSVGTTVLGMFGPTCYQEIDFYDRGEAIVFKQDCSPCYRKTCPNSVSCMSLLKPDAVYDVLEKVINYREH